MPTTRRVQDQVIYGLPPTKAGTPRIVNVASLKRQAREDLNRTAVAEGALDVEILVERWWFYTDADTMAAESPRHDCAACISGYDQAVAALREHPNTTVAVGYFEYDETFPEGR